MKAWKRTGPSRTKTRIAKIEERIKATKTPLPGVVRVCLNDEEIAAAEAEFEGLPKEVRRAIIVAQNARHDET